MSGDDTFQIVVGVDGSPQSLNALQWAVTEARLRRGRVQAVTAWSYPTMTDAAGLFVDYESFEQAARQVQAEALETVADEGIQLSTRIVQGPPAAVLLEAATGADLLVVGSRGHGGFTGLLLGSVSNQVVHHASCPVLIIRAVAEATAARP